MATPEEYTKILKMVESGKLTAEEGAKLIAALDESRKSESRAGGNEASGEARWFRVRVTDTATGKTSVNVNLPLGLVDIGLKMGARFSPEIEGMNMQRIVAAIKSGGVGKIFDVTDAEDGQHVEIFME
ncbi:MAG: hypothetical protein HY023_09300 [Chloroflexi bacterium]|nr:hypothetical protein [Chloroflexota bacterium]MBI3762250.1 hypothetical protein [Chloroflexota bacterium]